MNKSSNIIIYDKTGEIYLEFDDFDSFIDDDANCL